MMTSHNNSRGHRSVLVVHPSADRYGSDRQLVESLRGLVGAGWRVALLLASDGPLVDLVADAAPEVDISVEPFVGRSVLRKSLLRPLPFALLVLRSPGDLVRAVRRVRAAAADVVYVNTLTLPLWPLAARLAGRPSLVHVHEAEDDMRRLLRMALALPMLFATSIVTNSRASARTLGEALSSLQARTRVVVNGVPTPGGLVQSTPQPGRLVLVARLSPRKGIDVALDAVALLRAEGRNVSLDVCGTVFEGYEWYESELRRRAGLPDLAGVVNFRGYVAPTGPVLEAADVVLVPSRSEPFGNTAVEAQLAERPVIASAVQGLKEIVTDGRTGLLVPPGDPAALAAAVRRVLDEPGLGRSLARDGRDAARARFSVEHYRAHIVRLTGEVAGVTHPVP